METVSYLLQPKPGDKAPSTADEDDETVEDQDEDEAEQRRRSEPEDRLPDGLRARSPGAGQDAAGGAIWCRASKAFLDKVRAAEDKKVSQALEKLGVDWSAGAGDRAPTRSCS